MRFTTTFADCHSEVPCSLGYMAAAKALGGITSHGRNTETDIRELIEKLTMNELVWLLNMPSVFTMHTDDTVSGNVEIIHEVFHKVLAETIIVARKIPCATAAKQQRLDFWMNGATAASIRVDFWMSLTSLRRVAPHATKAILIAHFDKLAKGVPYGA